MLYRLATGDSSRRHIVVSLMDEAEFGPMLRTANIEVHALDMPSGRVTWKGLSRLYRLIKQEQPFIIQTWLYHADFLGGILGRLAGNVGVVWGLHYSELDKSDLSLATRLVMWLCARMSAVLPHRIISCSERGRTLHLERGYEPVRTIFVPNGYDFAKFLPEAQAGQDLRSQWRVADDELLIGMAARWDPQKGHTTLFEALQMLAGLDVGPWRCVLFGDEIDESNSALMAAIERYGIGDHLMLLGHRSDMPAVLSALDVHVLSSAFGEAFPNVLIEAMACGTPCVATDVGDAVNMLGDVGYSVPRQNPEALCGALVQVGKDVQNKDMWELKMDACRKHVLERYSLQTMVDAYGAVWAEAAQGQGDQ